MHASSDRRAQSAASAPLDLAAPFDGLAAPSDDGLSLNELSQAYAALLAKGADPYAEGTSCTSPDAAAPAPGHSEIPEVIAGADDDACEIAPRSILEAMLFVGHPTGEALASERIAALMRGVRPAEVDELVAELNELYAAEGAPYTILSVGAGYQLAIRPEFASLRDSFYGRIREARLSQASIDVLAIVAYHQPLSAPEIDRLRGKPSGAVLAQLVRRDLLTIERSADPKPKIHYRTTARFLALFGLEDLADLPRGQPSEEP